MHPGADLGAIQAVRLHEIVASAGFTDIEIESDRAAVVLEAKRGTRNWWVLIGTRWFPKMISRSELTEEDELYVGDMHDLRVDQLLDLAALELQLRDYIQPHPGIELGDGEAAK